MADTKCKTCRRNNQKLFLKGEKCPSPKCPMTRKPYAPGKRTRRPKPLSEFGLQLREKQKLKFLYGLREKQFSNYFKKSMNKGGADIGFHAVQMLELRLDNVVYKMGFATSRSMARQMVGHGHFLVNNRKVTIPSYLTKKGDHVSIKQNSASKTIFADLDLHLKKYEPPSWINLDKEKKEGEVSKLPPKEDIELDINFGPIIEFYSR